MQYLEAMKKSPALFLAIVSLLAGCAKDSLQGKLPVKGESHTIYGTIADPTRTDLSENGGVWRLNWIEGEQIAVVSGENVFEFDLFEGAGTARAKFTGNADFSQSETRFAVSPYDNSAYSSSDTLYTNYAEELIFNDYTGNVEGSNLMVARTTDSVFAFRNVCAYIALEISSPTEEVIKSLSIFSGSGSDITGPVAVTFDKSGKPSVKMVPTDESGKAITVDCCSAITIGPSTTAKINIPVLPVFPDGFDITIFTDSGKSMSVSSKSGIAAGDILQMPAIEFVPTLAAEVNGVQCYSFDAALDAATDAESEVTIKLLNDCRIGGSGEVYNPYFPVTLDLNGHTLTSMVDRTLRSAKDNKLLIIDDTSSEGKGTITNIGNGDPALKVYGPTLMRGGNIETSYRGVNVYNSWFKITGGSIHTTSSYCIYATKNDSEDVIADSVIVAGEDVTISSEKGCCAYIVRGDFYGYAGKIIAKGNIAVYEYDGHARLYDGIYCQASTNVVAGSRSSAYNSLVSVFGGRYNRTATTNGIIYGHLTTDSTRVTGGFFTDAIGTDYIPAGYQLQAIDTTIEGVNYRACVTEAPEVVATVRIEGGEAVEKATVNDAFDAAITSGRPSVITLLSDCSMVDTIGFNKDCDVTLDLCGKVLTANKRIYLRDAGSKFTVKSSVEGGEILQPSSGAGNAVLVYDGKFLLESGAIKGNSNSSSTVYVQKNGSFEMTGGEISAPEFIPLNVINDAVATIRGGRLSSEDTTENVISITTPAVVNLYGGNFDMPPVSHTGGVKFAGSGTLNIFGGEYSGELSSSCAILNISGGRFIATDRRALRVEGGTVNIDGGYFEAGYKYGTIQSRGASTVIINDGEFIGNGSSIRTLYTGDNAAKSKGNLVVNGGKVTTDGIAVYGYYGSVTVNGGTFSANNVMYAGVSGKVNVFDGYFNILDKDKPYMTGPSAHETVSGGWFVTAPADTLLNPLYKVEAQTTEKDGVTYNYRVIPAEDIPDVCQVNGKGYKTFEQAFNAATEANENVTMKLVGADTVHLVRTMDFTNVNGKEITLDLNGRILNGTVDSLITTKGVLTITDSSPEKSGKVYAAKRRLITLGSKGTINLKGCTVQSARANWALYDSYCSAVVIYGSKASPNAVLNVSDGARIITDNWFKAIWLAYGTLNLENCEVTVHKEQKYKKNGVVQSFHCISTSTGAVVNINEGTSLYSPGNGYAVLYSADVCTVNVNGGYFCGDGIIKCSAARIISYTLNGGLYNCPLDDGQTPKYGTGKSFKPLSSPVTHKHDGVDLTYSYIVE